MREVADRGSHHSCVKPLMISISLFRVISFSSFFARSFNSLTATCKCDFVLISPRSERHRGSMQCVRSLSQTITSYSSNLTPYPYWKQQQSCTPAGVYGEYSLSYGMFVATSSRLSDKTWQSWPSTFSFHLSDALYIPLFFFSPQQWWEIWIAILIQPASNRKTSVQGYFAA